MKQKLYFMTMLLGAILTLSACSSDDDSDNKSTSLIGNWYAQGDDEEYDIRFLANGKIQLITSEEGSKKYRDSGTYQTNGNKVTITWTKSEYWGRYSDSWITDDEETETIVLKFKIKGDHLYLSKQGEDESMVMTRK